MIYLEKKNLKIIFLHGEVFEFSIILLFAFKIPFNANGKATTALVLFLI